MYILNVRVRMHTFRINETNNPSGNKIDKANRLIHKIRVSQLSLVRQLYPQKFVLVSLHKTGLAYNYTTSHRDMRITHFSIIQCLLHACLKRRLIEACKNDSSVILSLGITIHSLLAMSHHLRASPHGVEALNVPSASPHSWISSSYSHDGSLRA